MYDSQTNQDKVVLTEDVPKVICEFSLTSAALGQLAADIVDQKVFVDRYCDPSDIAMIFMPLALGAFEGYPLTELDKIGMVYEYYDKAGPRSVNGFPSFFSFNILMASDLNRLQTKIDEYRALKDKFLK